MTAPFVGEIKMFAGNFAPRNYALCNGQILSIAQNTALFSLLGTTYGGNGTTNFALPNMQSRTPIHCGNSTGPGLSPYDLGQQGGEVNVTLTNLQQPSHNHQISGAVIANSSPSNAPSANAAYTNSAPNLLYAATSANLIALAPQSISFTGGGQPHNNLQPYLVVTFIIALNGLFPARN